MIKDFELRKGNKVIFEGIIAEIIELRNKYARIKYIRPDKNIEHCSLVEYERIDPIKITERVLMDCGAIFNPHEGRYELKGFSHNIDFEYITRQGFTDLWIDGFSHVKHLHQLQNLYFALNNESFSYEIFQP